MAQKYHVTRDVTNSVFSLVSEFYKYDWPVISFGDCHWIMDINTGKQFLSLYKRLLSLHKTHLPVHMRKLGDSYVRKEFKDHLKAKPEFLGSFLTEWTKYAQNLERKEIGKDLEKEHLAKLSDEQKINLQSLRNAAKTN